jgi:hypothetical protein
MVPRIPRDPGHLRKKSNLAKDCHRGGGNALTPCFGPQAAGQQQATPTRQVDSSLPFAALSSESRAI